MSLTIPLWYLIGAPAALGLVALAWGAVIWRLLHHCKACTRAHVLGERPAKYMPGRTPVSVWPEMERTVAAVAPTQQMRQVQP